MLKNKKLGCLSLLLLSPMAMAMQPLDDQSLSATTGQDGISVGVNLSKVNFNQAAIIDKYGFTTTALGSTVALNSKAALVMAASQGAASPTIGVDFVQTFNADGSIVHNPAQLLNMSIDTDAGAAANGGAFANIALSLGNGVNGMRIRPFSVYLVPDNVDAISSLTPTYTQKSIFSSGTTLKSNIKELLRTDNIDIKFVSTNKPRMNIQLGASPQGHMVMFGGAIDSVCGTGSGCNMMLVADYATAGVPSTAYGVGFDLQMKSTDINGFSLDGFYAGIESGGVVFGNTGTSDKFDLSLNNIMLGKAGASNANEFNGLKNGSMGNMGAIGTSVTNFKMRVSGM